MLIAETKFNYTDVSYKAITAIIDLNDGLLLGLHSVVVKRSKVSVAGAAYIFGMTTTSSQCWK